MKRILYSILLLLSLHGITKGQCNAGFGYTVNANTVNFISADSVAYGSIWYFGDGTSSYGVSLSHAYNSSGTFTVKHIVTDTIANCIDSSQQNITVSFTPSCSASFTYYRDSLNLGVYSFFDQSTIIGSTFSSAQWTVNGIQAQGNGQYFSYQFPQTGIYNVCEILQTTSGCSSTSCQNISISSLDSCNLNASFTSAPTQSNPLSIRFTASADNTPDVVYSWSFGDGTTDTTKNPVHTYNKGIYNVTLEKSLQNDSFYHCSAVFSSTVYVNIGPGDTCSASFTYTANPGEPNSISFTAGGSQPLVSEQWTFMSNYDSSQAVTSLVNNPVYTFTGAGPYTVTLKIVTQSGCTATDYMEQVYIDSLAADSISTNSVLPMVTYPNPATSKINLHVTLPSSNNIIISVYSSMGSLLIKKQVAGNTGDNPISIPVETLQSGVYFMEINYGNSVKFTRFQKL